MKRTTKRTAVFIVGFATWCALNWVPDREHLVIGFFVSLFVAFMVGDLFVDTVEVLKHPKRYGYFIFQYIPVLIWEVIKTNIDVAYRILHPQLLINPGIVKVKTSLKSDLGLAFLANSITLTPGTMVVDVDKQNGVLYVHWIDVKSRDIDVATKLIVERFEKILRKIFD